MLWREIMSVSNAGSHRQVFREEIRNAIREQIFAGILKPGDRIIETYWAKKMGVSQGPVREAIRDLEAMGLVETIPFKGSRVRTMTEKDIRDNYSVRICLESKSVRDAIVTLDDEQLNQLITTLRDVLLEMDKHAKTIDLQHFSDADALFHKSIILSTGNMVLLKLWEQCNIRNWFMFTALKDSNSLQKLQFEHQELTKAIQSRNIEQATVILENHLTNLMHEYIYNKI